MDPKNTPSRSRAGRTAGPLILALVVGLLSLALFNPAMARKLMPAGGVWKVVTLQFYASEDSPTLLGTISHDGSNFSLSDNIDFGSTPPALVTSRTVLIPALAMHSTGSVEVINGKATWAIADASADEFVYATILLPDDLDATNSLGFVQVEYLCDQATPTEGEFNIAYGGFADDDADAALTSLGNLVDTSPAQNDWSVTTIGATSTIPAAALTPGETLYLSVGHDVSDQFCGGSDINVASLRFTYTSDQISN